MGQTVYTIGYEGAEISQFLQTLTASGIENVLDIRDLPLSRKPGFSKSSLAAALLEQGIGYRHLKALGDPKPGREAMRRGDYPAFLEIYSRHLATEPAQDALRDAVASAAEQRTALLCFERNPNQCHRTVVATTMVQMAAFEICNLGVSSHSNRSKSIRGRVVRISERDR